ncbi:redox-active disulfide protein 2 [Flavobacterium sp. RHBU_24]|uniref:redox-active disulfide protein 2 n=1 Tax=Flavobacterium sp. RHBU_24 TaxID=3391185 RepID=UPI003984D9AE
MKSKKPAEMTNEELLKSKKILAPVTYMLAGMLGLLFCLNIYNSLTKGFSALSVVPIALLPILIINLNAIKEINKEIKARNL